MKYKKIVTLSVLILSSASFLFAAGIRYLLRTGGDEVVTSFLMSMLSIVVIGVGPALFLGIPISYCLESTRLRKYLSHWGMISTVSLFALAGAFFLILLCSAIKISDVGKFRLLGYMMPEGRCVLVGYLNETSLSGSFSGVLETSFSDSVTGMLLTTTTTTINQGHYESERHHISLSPIALTIPLTIPDLPLNSKNRFVLKATLNGKGVTFSDSSQSKSAWGPGGGTVYYSTKDYPIDISIGSISFYLPDQSWFHNFIRWTMPWYNETLLALSYLALLEWMCFVVYFTYKKPLTANDSASHLIADRRQRASRG